jgi:hypothetical protein
MDRSGSRLFQVVGLGVSSIKPLKRELFKIKIVIIINIIIIIIISLVSAIRPGIHSCHIRSS